MNRFSLSRWFGIIAKEFIQLKRDRLTFGMIVGVPVMQLLLFGFAINADPKNLPAAVYSADNSPYARTFVRAMENSGYFRGVTQVSGAQEAEDLIAHGEVQFVVNIPADFSRRLVRGEQPQILVEADATDPSATNNAIGALQVLAATALVRDLAGPLADLNPTPGNPTLENAGGDVSYETDFRSVYARVLDGWLGTDSVGILGGDFRDRKSTRLNSSHIPLSRMPSSA